MTRLLMGDANKITGEIEEAVEKAYLLLSLIRSDDKVKMLKIEAARKLIDQVREILPDIRPKEVDHETYNRIAD